MKRFAKTSFFMFSASVRITGLRKTTSNATGTEERDKSGVLTKVQDRGVRSLEL